MPNLTNNITTLANFEIKKAMVFLRNSSQEISTGRNIYGPIDYIVGTKLKDTSKILCSVAKGVGYGVNLLVSAQSQLDDIKTKLTNLHAIIIQANTASPDLLHQLNELYAAGVTEIIRKLETSNFAGRKLFDGSLSNSGNLPPVRSESLPPEAMELNIRVGESVYNTIEISIPRLLSGDGSSIDIPAAGRFTPLFPVKLGNGAEAAAERDRITVNIAADINRVIAAARARHPRHLADIRDIVGVINQPAIGASSGTIAATNSAIAVVSAAIASVEKNVANVINAFIAVITATAQGSDAAGDEVGARNTIATIMAAIQHQSNIQGVIDAIDGVILPFGASNVVKSIYDAAKAVRDVVNAVTHPGIGYDGQRMISQEKVIKAIVDGAKAAANVQIEVSIKAITTADILTKIGQEAANATILNALAIVSNLLTEINGKTKNLQLAFDDINNMTRVHYEAGNKYLTTNYEDAAKNFKLSLLSMLGSISIITQNYLIADAVLELV